MTPHNLILSNWETALQRVAALERLGLTRIYIIIIDTYHLCGEPPSIIAHAHGLANEFTSNHRYACIRLSNLRNECLAVGNNTNHAHAVCCSCWSSLGHEPWIPLSFPFCLTLSITQLQLNGSEVIPFISDRIRRWIVA